MNKKVTTVIVAAAFIVGGGFGSASSQAGPAKAAPPTVKTVTVQGPERVVTRTVTKQVTPKGCIDALDLAGELTKAVADEHFAIADAASTASKDGDVTTFLTSMNAAIVDVTATTTRVAPLMTVAAAECRAN